MGIKKIATTTPKKHVVKEEKENNQLDNDYELQIQRIEYVRFKTELETELEKKEKKLRNFTVRLVMELVGIWMFFTMAVIGYYAFSPSKGLSDKVLCTLLGTTAIVSLANTVLKGLFQRKK